MNNKEKNINDFDIFYQNLLKIIVDDYYEQITKKEKSIIRNRFIFFIIFIIGIIIYIYAFNLNDLVNKTVVELIIAGLFLILIILVFSAKLSIDKLFYEMNGYLIKDIISFITNQSTDDIIFEPNKRLDIESFNRMHLFNLKESNYNGKNFIKVKYNNKYMVFSDIETYTSSIIVRREISYNSNGIKNIRYTTNRKKEVIFSGLYIGSTINKKIDSQIYLIPNNFKDRFANGKILKYIDFHGTQVKLENLNLSKKYIVLCDDEIAARYILSLSLMEKINEVDKIFDCKKYIVFREGTGISICLQGYTIEKLKYLNMPYIKNDEKIYKSISKMFNSLNDLFRIYHILDLGNETYDPNVHNKY